MVAKKIIRGKEYELFYSFKEKETADGWADDFRGRGYYPQVVYSYILSPHTNEKLESFSVFVRPKQKSKPKTRRPSPRKGQLQLASLL